MQVTQLIFGFFILSLVSIHASFQDRLPSSQRLPASELTPPMQCRPDFMGCRVNVDCCSHKCSGGVCRRAVLPLGVNGWRCRFDRDCFSNYCDNTFRCRANIQGKLLSTVGQYCQLDRECYSGYCDQNKFICRGNINASPSNKAYVAQFCELDAECKSGRCARNPYRFCQGSPSDPAGFMEPCLTTQNECGEGLACDLAIFRCRRR